MCMEGDYSFCTFTELVRLYSVNSLHNYVWVICVILFQLLYLSHELGSTCLPSALDSPVSSYHIHVDIQCLLVNLILLTCCCLANLLRYRLRSP
jgi:hypothetical protein